MFVIQNMVHAALASDTDEISRFLSYRLIFGTLQDFQNKANVALELYLLECSSDAKKYLQNNAVKIAKAFAEGGDDVALSKFVALGLMDASAAADAANRSGEGAADVHSIPAGRDAEIQFKAS